MEIMVGLDQTNHHTLTQKRKGGGVRKRRKWAFLQASIEAAATSCIAFPVVNVKTI